MPSRLSLFVLVTLSLFLSACGSSYNNTQTQNPTPAIASLNPTNAAPGAGAFSLTVNGNGFISSSQVQWNGAGRSTTFVSSTQLTASITAADVASAGTATVTVVNPTPGGGTSQGMSFKIAGPPPAVTSVAPGNGPIAGGTAITVTGTGFLAGATVTVGGSPATNVAVVSATSITATTPQHAAGAVNVTVTNPDTQTSTLNNGFTYNPAPTVGSINPNTGSTAGGTAVTIGGTGFQSGASVTIGGSAATAVVVVSSTSITATTPNHTKGAADVVVTNTDGQSGTLAAAFTFTSPNPPPTVTSVAPPAGALGGGTSITITGTGFLAGATVTIGGTPATGIVVGSATSITATTPAHAAGAANVVVTNTDGQNSAQNVSYTYEAAPTVITVAPSSGSTLGGTAITITGTGFLAGAKVSVGGAAATGVTVVNATSITATTPANAAGAADVKVTNSDGQSGVLAGGFLYNTPPTVLSIAPSSGSAAGGTAVTITGTGFATGATVAFGSAAAIGVTVVNATTITATTPASGAGTVNVVVTNTNGLSGTLNNGYTYVLGPSVTSISPIDGLLAGGTAVTLTGAGFQTGATVTLGGTAASSVSVVNATTITATTPAHAAGTVAVTVTNPDLQSGTLANGFIYTPGPTLSSISPPAMGSGTPSFLLTATGSNFTPASVLRFNGINLNTTYVNNTQITGIVPAADIPGLGSAPVTVTDAGVTSSGIPLIIRNPVIVAGETLTIASLSRPSRIAFAPDGALFIAEQGSFGSVSTANILRVTISGGVGTAGVWATFPVNPGNVNYGLLGMALDPKNPPTATGGNIYIFYTAGTNTSNADNRLAKIGMSGAPVDLVTGLPVAAAPDPLSLNGSKLSVYPNAASGTSWLFLSTGGSDQHPDFSQTTNDLHGKILRFNTDGTVPADNPFGSTDPTYVCGFRNSVGFDFHPTAGTLYADDNGNPGLGASFSWQDSLDRALSGDAQGYGFTSSAHCQPNVTSPIWTGSSPVIQPAGMMFYTATLFPQLQNSVLMVGSQANAGAHIVYQFEVDEYNPTNPGQLVPSNPAPLGIAAFNPSGALSDITQGPDGCVYLSDVQNSAVYRIKPKTGSTCK